VGADAVPPQLRRRRIEVLVLTLCYNAFCGASLVNVAGVRGGRTNGYGAVDGDGTCGARHPRAGMRDGFARHHNPRIISLASRQRSEPGPSPGPYPPVCAVRWASLNLPLLDVLRRAFPRASPIPDWVGPAGKRTTNLCPGGGIANDPWFAVAWFTLPEQGDYPPRTSCPVHIREFPDPSGRGPGACSMFYAERPLPAVCPPPRKLDPPKACASFDSIRRKRDSGELTREETNS